MTSSSEQASKVLPRQHYGTDRTKGVVDTFEATVLAYLCTAVLELKKQVTVDAGGVWLDLLALRFGLLRPYKSISTSFFFGFDGNPQSTPFNQAPFRPDGQDLAGKIPLNDGLFLKLLKAQAGSLRTNGTQDNINQIVTEAYPGSYVTDGLDMSMTANLDLDLLDDDLALIIQQEGRIPKPAGVKLHINIVEGLPTFFGFNGNPQTVGFNESPFKPDGT